MRKFFCHGLLIALAVSMAGCMTTGSGSGDRLTKAALSARYNLPVINNQTLKPREGTIYREEGNFDLYRDRRAHAVGDILLVKIVETSSGAKKASTKTQRQSTITGDLTSLLGFGKWFSGKNANFTPSSTSLQAGLINDFDGQGETKRDSTVTATISARVVDVTLEGNMVIRGFREVRVNNESQFIILSGLVRPEDVSEDNTILSSYIADARIEYSGTGVLSDKQQPGWLARGLDVLWPF